jgi:hypothetical protein
MNYVYYCIYRFVSTTPDRAASDAWPIVFLALSMWIHGLIAYWIVTLVVGFGLESRTGRTLCVVIMLTLMIALSWHYVWKGNGERVVRSYQKLGREKKYAWIGALMFAETLLVVFMVGGLLIVSQKLFGWPPSR